MTVTDDQNKPAPLRRSRLGGVGVVGLFAYLVCLMVAFPLLAVVWYAFNPEENIWPHLAATVLPNFAATSALLALGVGAGVAAVGVGAAWLVAFYEFPGRRHFEWALMLPLAVPSYIVAYVATDVLEYAGPVQGALRAVFGWQLARDYWFPEIRSLGGAIVVLTLVLYPYVYLLTRAAFTGQSRAGIDAARTMGYGPLAAFWRVALPLARPGIVVGVALALMETVNDYGLVDFFAVPAFSAGIFHVWQNMSNTGGAAQMALVLLLFVFVLIYIERHSRRDRRFSDGRSMGRTTARTAPGRWGQAAAVIACLLPICLGFLIPMAVLISRTGDGFETIMHSGVITALWNSLSLSVSVAVAATLIGLFLAYAQRLDRTGRLDLPVRIATAGYAVPGAILAVGVLFPLARFDNWIDDIARTNFDVSTGLIFSGTLLALSSGCVIRFLMLTHGAGESGFHRISPRIDDAGRIMGYRPMQVARLLHWPLLRTSMITGLMLVFVDTMKELPMTIALRPFNFETLATLAHSYASDEQFSDAAPGALAIVLVGMLPVILMSRTMRADT